MYKEYNLHQTQCYVQGIYFTLKTGLCTRNISHTKHSLCTRNKLQTKYSFDKEHILH